MHCCSEAVKRFCMTDTMAPSQSSQIVGHAACPRSLLTRILALCWYTRSQGHTPGRNRRNAGTHISVVNVLEVQHEISPRSPPRARMSFIHDRWSLSRPSMLRMDCPKFLQSTRFRRVCGSSDEGLCARFEVLLLQVVCFAVALTSTAVQVDPSSSQMWRQARAP